MNKLAILVCLIILLFTVACRNKVVDKEKVVIRWGIGPDQTGINHRLVKEFEKENPTIKVEISEMPASTDTRHNQYATYLIAEDDFIDVYLIDVIWPAEFAAAGWAYPLDSWIGEKEREEFLPGPLESCIYNGHLYAVPLYTDAGVLYYRKDLLQKKGFSPPTTWDELLKEAKALEHFSEEEVTFPSSWDEVLAEFKLFVNYNQQNSIPAPMSWQECWKLFDSYKEENKLYGFVFQAGQYEGLVCNFLEYLWGNGGNVLEGEHVVLDTPEAVEALEFMRDLIKKYKITPPAITTYKEDEGLRLFISGKAVFLRSWPYVWGFAQDAEKGSKVVGRVGITGIPTKDGKIKVATLGGWNLMISAFTRHPEECWKLVKFMTSYDVLKKRLLEDAFIPTRKAVFSDREVIAKMPYLKDMYPIFLSARSRPVTPLYSKVSDILQIQIHKAITEKISPEEAIKRASEEIKAIPGFK